VYRPDRAAAWLSWLGDERVAIGNLPTWETMPRLVPLGVTHVVNCRAPVQVMMSQDLGAERDLFGRDRVAYAPMWDFGQAQPPRRWAAAVRFATDALDADPAARVFIHCHQGRRRSVLIAYAVLRLRGYGVDDATTLIASHRSEAELVPAYTKSVESWLAGGAAPIGRLRLGNGRE